MAAVRTVPTPTIHDSRWPPRMRSISALTSSSLACHFATSSGLPDASIHGDHALAGARYIPAPKFVELRELSLALFFVNEARRGESRERRRGNFQCPQRATTPPRVSVELNLPTSTCAPRAPAAPNCKWYLHGCDTAAIGD